MDKESSKLQSIYGAPDIEEATLPKEPSAFVQVLEKIGMVVSGFFFPLITIIIAYVLYYERMKASIYMFIGAFAGIINFYIAWRFAIPFLRILPPPADLSTFWMILPFMHYAFIAVGLFFVLRYLVRKRLFKIPLNELNNTFTDSLPVKRRNRFLWFFLGFMLPFLGLPMAFLYSQEHDRKAKYLYGGSMTILFISSYAPMVLMQLSR